MNFQVAGPSFPAPGYSQGDGLDDSHSRKILLNNCVNDRGLSSVSSSSHRISFLITAVNHPVTVGDDEAMDCSMKQHAR